MADQTNSYNLQLNLANNSNALLSQLEKNLQSKPLSSPFAKELFLVGNEGIEAYLTQELASKLGIFANYKFTTINAFLNEIMRKINYKHLVEQNLLWEVDNVLDELSFAGVPIIQQYIKKSSDGVYQFQLAEQLARCFARYSIYRPEMIKLWQNDKLATNLDCEIWQKKIWQAIFQNKNSMADIWQDTFQQIKDQPSENFKKLIPERISIFGVNHCPKVIIQFLDLLAKYTEVDFYLFCPQKFKKGSIVNRNKETHNPLLNSLGSQIEDLKKIFAEFVNYKIVSSKFQLTNGITNLECIQNDIFQDKHSTKSQKYDGSVIIHNCHSELRELEIIKDEIINVLNNNSNLSLRDVIVMAPGISDYVSYIPAIFNDIEYSIADVSIRENNTLVDGFFCFIDVISGRFGWQKTLDLLALPDIYKSFSLYEADLEQILSWISETNIRWAASKEQKGKLGLPMDKENTWEAGIEQLLVGFAVGDEDKFVNDVLPFANIEGFSAQILGQVKEFLDLLFNANDDIAISHNLNDWVELLFGYIDILFNYSDGSLTNKNELKNKIATLSDDKLGFYNKKISFNVVVAWLKSNLSDHRSPRGFLKQGITFSSMQTMRSIPKKVVILLGMNEGSFPHNENLVSFDIMQLNKQFGDSSKCQAERYLFLETILNAEKKLIICYIGQQALNNELLPPSGLVSELTDILIYDYKIHKNDLYRKHFLHGFKQSYFNPTSKLFSYNQFYYDLAKQQLKQFQEKAVLCENNRKPWWPQDLKLESLERPILEVNELIQFAKNPQKYFLRNILQLNLSAIASTVVESEPFEFNALETNFFIKEMVEHILTNVEGIKKRELYEKYKAKGMLLGAKIGWVDFEEKYDDAEIFANAIKSLELGIRIEDLNIDILVDGHRILGELTECYQGGLLNICYGKRLTGKFFIEALVRHLIANKVNKCQSYILYKDKNDIGIRNFNSEICLSSPLESWLQLYIDGQREPSKLLVEPGFSYVQQSFIKKTKSTISPIKKAQTELERILKQDYNKELQFLYGKLSKYELEELLGNEFIGVTEDILKESYALVMEVEYTD